MRMLREKEVENKDKKQNMFAALFVVIGFLSFSLWICDILLNKGQSRQLDLFSARMTDFLADFTNTSGYCAFRSPYDNIAYAGFWHKQYPPFAYIFFWVFSKFSWKMESYYATNNFLNMYQEPFFLVMLILVYVICCIIIFELVRKNMKGSEILRYGVAVTVILSFPMLFSIERGNNTLFASIFTMIYLFEYDSCSKCRREIALISLAVAAATKLFPAIFGILLLYQKRWKDALRTVLYGAALSVLPFFFFGGGFQYNYTLWIRNIRLAAEMHSPFEGCSIAAVIAGFVPASIATEKGRLFFACCQLSQLHLAALFGSALSSPLGNYSGCNNCGAFCTGTELVLLLAVFDTIYNHVSQRRRVFSSMHVYMGGDCLDDDSVQVDVKYTM